MIHRDGWATENTGHSTKLETFEAQSIDLRSFKTRSSAGFAILSTVGTLDAIDLLAAVNN